MGRRPTGNPRGRPPHPGLTPAEERVLDGLKRGLSNAEIAAELGISWTTVKYHVANVLGKLDAESRHELASVAEPPVPDRWPRFRAAAIARIRPRPVIATTAAFSTAAAVVAALLLHSGGGDPVTSSVPATTTTVPMPAVARPGAPTVMATMPANPTEEPMPPNVAALLARPLDLPGVAPGEPCPVTPGRDASPAVASASGAGPVYAGAGNGIVPLWPVEDVPGWFSTKIAWTIDRSVEGPVVLRGARIDAPGVLRWQSPPDHAPDWTSFEALLVGVSGIKGFRSGISDMPVGAPGCYAVQVDGEKFQEIIILRAVVETDLAEQVTLSLSTLPPAPVGISASGLGPAELTLFDSSGKQTGAGPGYRWSWLGDGTGVLVTGNPGPLVLDRDGDVTSAGSAWNVGGSSNPRGDRLALTTMSDQGASLELAELRGSNIIVTHKSDGGPSWNGQWSPGGGAVAFMTERDGDPEIYSIDAVAFDERRITDSPGFDGYPTWSPDGSQIAWEATHDMRRGIWLMDADGGNQHQLAPTDGAVDWFPAWSPDGSRLSFVSNRDGGWRIYSMAADGTDLRRVTDGPGSDWAPQWSPDGEWIGFVSNREGTPELWVVRPDGSNLQRVTTTTGGFVDSFAWAPQ